MTINGFCRSWIYKPVALLLAILVLPSFSWMDANTASSGPFTVTAQSIIISGCTADPTSNKIVRQYCVTSATGNTVSYGTDLVQLESDAVSTYLSLHNMSGGDAQVIYNYGRSDLRSAIRAEMMALLIGMVKKSPSLRTAHEQNLINWLTTIVQNNEISLYRNALNQYLAWQNNHCGFVLDPAVASAYNLSYDGIPFCGSPLNGLLAGPPVPAESYFTAYGMRKSYGASADAAPYFGSLVTRTGVNLGAIAGSAAGVGSLAAVGSTGAIASDVSTLLESIANEAAVSDAVADSIVVGADGAAVLSGSALVAGPAAIILIAIAIGVTAGVQAFSSEQVISDLNNLQALLNQVSKAPPDLAAFHADTTGLGGYKVQMSLASQTLPEISSSVTLPDHRNSDLNFAIQGGGSYALSSTLSYEDWIGNIWSAQTWGGWLVQTCSGTNCAQPDSITGDLEYIDWSGVPWTAARYGNVFSLTKVKPAPTDIRCPADGSTGVTPGTDFSNCYTYVATSFPLTDSQGNHATVSLSLLAPPVFTSPKTLSFAPGVSSVRTVTASGNPTPSICYSSGNLPTGFTFNGGSCGEGTFTIAYDGSNVAQGSYNVALTASGSGTPVTQPISVDVATQLQITSPQSISPVPGVPFSFTVTTTGYPAPALSLDPLFHLPSGVTFQDNHDGTATLSGKLPALQLYVCSAIVVTGQPPANPPSNCGIIATNSQGTVEAPFAINASGAPVASVLPPASATFYAGVPNSIVLSSTGASTPVTTWGFTSNQAAPWLGLQTNDSNNGTATLSGTPPIGTSGSFTVGVTPFAQFSATDVSLLISTPFTVNVVNAPLFTSSNSAAFYVGSDGSFPVTVNMGTVSLVSTLPKGLSFTSSSITGTPAPGTGGQYTIQLVDNADAAGSVSQNLNLNVFESAALTSANTATFIAGKPGSFAVTTTGFPSISTHPVAADAPPPTGPTDGEGMHFTVTGLPPSLQASNLTPQGFAGGTLTIQGTPSASDAGLHQLQITAQNGVGAAARQTLMLNVINVTAPAPRSGSTCNGTYNGTFKGNLTVSAGQNCTFIGGAITGNISVNGGNLSIANTNVSGNISIQGASAFSIDQGTTVGGNLLIQSVASGAKSSQICETKVNGNLQVTSNAILISIGSPQNYCYGNTVAGNLSIQGNTAAIEVYDNKIQKNLSCSANASITGAGDSGSKLTGQCAAF